MPEGVKDVFDIKTIILVALLGGSNLGTYFGLAAPAQTVTNETQAAAEILSDELKQCWKELKECYKECGPARSSETELRYP
jgi:hypothetical protein